MKRRTGAALMVCMVMWSTSLSAQRLAESPDRDASGPFVSAGAGFTSVHGDCSFCSDWGGSGLALRSSLGWRFSRRIALMVNVDGGIRTQGATRERHAQITGGPELRVWRAMTVQAGIGRTLLHQEVSTTADTLVVKGSAVGWALGLGYEVPFGDRVVATPYLTYRRSASMDLERNGGVVTPGYTFHVLEAGVSLTWSLRSLIWPSERDRAPE